jgi:hypothetical protein
MSVSEKIDPIYNWALKAGTMLKNRKIKTDKKEKKTDKSTVDNILSLFQSILDPKDAALMTMMYIKRQIAREEIEETAGHFLLQKLYEFYNNYYNDDRKLRDNISKFLTLMKWAYESKIEEEIEDFNAFIEYIRKKG